MASSFGFKWSLTPQTKKKMNSKEQKLGTALSGRTLTPLTTFQTAIGTFFACFIPLS